MSQVQELITKHIDIWTAAETEKKSGRGRASSNANSVYGIKKLRELILELAVRGKLVPQDANDEPASELLKRIQLEKVKLQAEGKIGKCKEFIAISKDEKLFEIPPNWLWIRLGNIIEYVNGYAFSSKDFSSIGTGVVKIGDIQSGKLTPESMSRVSNDIVKDLDARLKVEPGDLVIAMSGATTGKLGFNDTKDIFYLNQRVGKIVPFIISKKFLYFDLTTKILANLEKSFGSAIPNLSTEQINTIVIALPPIEEQHRIVAKVDELMALCDQLEAQHNNADEAHEQLVSHLLSTLTQSQDAEDFNANWQRIATHFDTLFTTESSIDALKQTLLQLAVMGKLVPQDPKDEPANELLKRIQAEKAKLVAEGKIKKDKPLAAIAEDEKCFNLPIGWEWTRLGAMVEKSGAGWSPSCEAYPRIGSDWGVLKVSAVSWGKFLPNENKALPKSLEARLDCVVEKGDFLISRANTAELVARSVVIKECPPNLMLSDKIVRLRLSSLCDNQFINLVNASSFSRAYYLRKAGGTSSSMKNVTREQILNLLIGNPPLEEQHRIVAKVEELLTLCEQLKSRITEACLYQQKLADIVTTRTVS